jgi:nucleoside-diphosphate-sugar epimerase
MRTNILVTGANGFVGKALCQSLMDLDYSLTAVVRNRRVLDETNTVSVGEIGPTTNWTAVLAGIDVVIHLAAQVHVMQDNIADSMSAYREVNTLGTLHLAEQAAALGVKRFIFLSTVKVNGESTLDSHAFKETHIPYPEDAYAVSKWEAEQGLLALAERTGIEVVIIRPPLVYGSGVKANFANMLKMVQNVYCLPLGGIGNRRSLVYLGNLVNLIVLCIHHPEAKNQVFFVSDDEDISTTELLKMCAAALGVNLRLFNLPEQWVAMAAKLLGKQAITQRLYGSLQVDISKVKRILGWSPPFSLAEGIQQTAFDWLQENNGESSK